MKKKISKIYGLYGAGGASAGILPFAKNLCDETLKFITLMMTLQKNVI